MARSTHGFGMLTHAMGDKFASNPHTPNEYKLLFALASRMKPADKFTGVESQTIAAAGVDVASAFVVQMSLDEASRIMGKRPTEAKRQFDRLIEHGYITRVGAWSKGHAQLYLIVGNAYTSHECVPKQQADGYTSHECVPNDADGYTSEGECVHITGEIGTHREPLNSGDAGYQEELTINNQNDASGRAAASEAPRPCCPQCGDGDVVASESGFFTCGNGHAWR